MIQEIECMESDNRFNNNEIKSHSIKSLSPIFIIKKYSRNGLFEKRKMKIENRLTIGKWSKEEHFKFIKASLIHNGNWKKIKEELQTRTQAQIKSHAQKYMIHLCKKYNIEIKSKRTEKFSLDHLNFPYKRKSVKLICPIENISITDLRILKNFNFYFKKINFEEIEKKSERIFKIQKVVRNTKKETKQDAENSVNNDPTSLKVSSSLLFDHHSQSENEGNFSNHDENKIPPILVNYTNNFNRNDENSKNIYELFAKLIIPTIVFNNIFIKLILETGYNTNDILHALNSLNYLITSSQMTIEN